MKSTLIIGSSVCDVNIYVQQFPQITGDENIIKQEMTMGGCAWNVSAVFRQLQLPYTLFSPIGKGFYGDFVKAQFQKNHVPVFIETSQKNGCCYCVVDKQGERTFLCEHGGEYIFQKDWFTQLDMSLYQAIYICGLDIEEVRITHLAYAEEIAAAMLQRQQASAIIAARQKIVDGAVGMVKMAIDKLGEEEVVVLDEERKATMVSNLLVVLCSNKDTQPVVNSGSIY